ncbi:Epi6-like protease inhibitor [Phytophthora megakarya]|uniref:Epi6-like protease inhibitor n=1 Tax=Phytophthora megakarya TaxID=4795 RepID=A0A225X3Q4_9STRA|nr:Epi6-like protease inhibitor [Phytophthora megakarya]
MKFAATLLFAAFAATAIHAENLRTSDQSTSSNCPDACLDVYQPVTDEDGKTYSNECYMQAAKCKGTKKDEDPLEEYKRLYGKSFGASRDSDASTKSDDSSKDKSASGDGSTTPKSYCPNIACPAVYNPVTDENGVTYSNECEMEAAKCKGPRENPLDEYKRIYGKEFGAERTDNE